MKRKSHPYYQPDYDHRCDEQCNSYTCYWRYADFWEAGSRAEPYERWRSSMDYNDAEYARNHANKYNVFDTPEDAAQFILYRCPVTPDRVYFSPSKRVVVRTTFMQYTIK